MFQRLGRLEKEVTELSPMGRGIEGGNVMWGQQSHFLSEVSLFNRAQPCRPGRHPCLSTGSLV